MTNYKSLVPRTMIPQVYPVCPRCGAGTKGVLGTAHADGYHRRHVCQACQYGFYTLAPYDGEDYQVSARPFKDRDLTEFEMAQRQQWWEEYEQGYGPRKMKDDLPRKVSEVLPRGRPPPFLSRIGLALRTAPENRTQVDKFLVAGYEMMHKKVATMEKEIPNGRQDSHEEPRS